MPRSLLVVFALLLAACARPSPAGVQQLALADADGGAGDMAVGGMGFPCDPQNDCHDEWTCAPDCVAHDPACCVVNKVCPVCADGLICTLDFVCDGPRCGMGNVVCHDPTICEAAGNCVPPCRDAAGEVIYDGEGGCESVGERTAADGRCYIPEWFRLCARIGGH